MPHTGTALHPCFSKPLEALSSALLLQLLCEHIYKPPGVPWCILIPPPAQLQLRAWARPGQQSGGEVKQMFKYYSAGTAGCLQAALVFTNSFLLLLHSSTLPRLIPATSKLCWWQGQGTAGAGMCPRTESELLRAPLWTSRPFKGLMSRGFMSATVIRLIPSQVIHIWASSWLCHLYSLGNQEMLWSVEWKPQQLGNVVIPEKWDWGVPLFTAITPHSLCVGWRTRHTIPTSSRERFKHPILFLLFWKKSIILL